MPDPSTSDALGAALRGSIRASAEFHGTTDPAKCDHDWRSADNSVVRDTEICPRCWHTRSAGRPGTEISLFGELPARPVETRERPAWIVWINADLTEGRGPMQPRYVCAAEATAHRRAHRADVQGADAPVVPATLRWEPVQGAYGPGHAWVGPVVIEEPTDEDRRLQERLDAEAAKARARDAAIERARALGLSDDDIAALRGEATAKGGK